MKFLILSLLSVLVLDLQLSSASKKLYEQSCKQTEDCDENLGLSCQNKVCKCAAGGETVHSLTTRRCVGAAGRECLHFANETLCIENSQCQNYDYIHMCACRDTFYQSKDGHCYTVGKYGETCKEEDFSCGDSMMTSVSCMDKKCRCLLGEENQYFDPIENKCTSNAGGQCLNIYPDACTRNSKCDSIYENINGALFHVGHRCRCISAYSYTKDKHCLASYMSPCNVANPCNYDQHLGCVDDICQCRNALHEIYNEILGQCALLVGSACKKNEGPQCVQNANCVSPSKKCECKIGFSVTPVGTCLIDIGQRCEAFQCNHFNALTCINGTCQCLDENLKYEKEIKACVGLKDFPCGNVSVYVQRDKSIEANVLCEANSTCARIGFVGSVSTSRRYCKASSSKAN